MNLTPRYFNLAMKAGLTLVGQDEDREPQYMGTREQFEEYDRLLTKDSKGEEE